MPGFAISEGGWVVVCDGSKALVLQNFGDSRFPNLKTVEVFEQTNPSTHEQGADKPGRVWAAGATYERAAVEQTDWHSRSEELFLTRLAKHLDSEISAGKTKSIVIVAPRRALGMLRPAYSHALKNILQAEVDKDLVKIPVQEIEKHLANLRTAAQ